MSNMMKFINKDGQEKRIRLNQRITACTDIHRKSPSHTRQRVVRTMKQFGFFPKRKDLRVK